MVVGRDESSADDVAISELQFNGLPGKSPQPCKINHQCGPLRERPSVCCRRFARQFPLQVRGDSSGVRTCRLDVGEAVCPRPVATHFSDDFTCAASTPHRLGANTGPNPLGDPRFGCASNLNRHIPGRRARRLEGIPNSGDRAADRACGGKYQVAGDAFTTGSESSADFVEDAIALVRRNSVRVPTRCTWLAV